VSLADAKNALYEALCESPLEGTPHADIAPWVASVYRNEPRPGELPKPAGITLFTDGIDPTEYRIRVRIYVDPSQSVGEMQDHMDCAIEAVADLLDSDPQFGRASWEHGYDASIDALIAQAVYEVGREDF